MKEQWRTTVTKARRALPVIGVALGSFFLGGLVFGLFRKDPQTPPAPSASEGRPDSVVWTCSMHPQIRSPEPGKCPICGMDLIPANGASTEKDAIGPKRVVLSERAAALARLRTTEVALRQSPAMELRLLGRIEPDETSQRTVTSWINGRIDRLIVKVTGERVKAGQAIATLYSPEVFTAHQDLLTAKKQVDRLAGASELARTAADAALSAARSRLSLLGISEGEIGRMESATSPTKHVAIRTPFAGTVIERLASEGAYVTTGAPIYRIADLSKLWVLLDAYENDLSRLAVGQTVRIEVEAYPGEPFEGRVSFIDPQVDPGRRTARIRVEVNNDDGRLRPGMFVQAVVAATTGDENASLLTIPDTAPLFTGKRSLVYVEVKGASSPTYEAREVRLGPRSGHVYPVVSGLSPGERVVTKGAFVLDADLQIRGGASMMSMTGEPDKGPTAVIDLPDPEREKLRPVLAGYLDIARALADDDLPSAAKTAGDLAQRVSDTHLTSPKTVHEAWMPISTQLRHHLGQIAHAETLSAARNAFEGLSREVELILQRFGNPLDEPVQLAFCSMALGSRGASWFQRGEKIDNAYFGEAMRSCGEIRESVAPGTHLKAVEPGPAQNSASPGGHAH